MFRTLPTALAPLLLTLACSHHGSPPAAQPAPPPLQVVAVDPSPGQINVAQRGQVSATFAEDLAGQTDADFEVRDALGPLAGLHTYDPATHRWTWTPLFELPRGATLRAVLAAGLQGQSGTALAAPYEWTFLVREGAAAQPQDLAPVPQGSHVFAVAARTGVGALACGETVYESVASTWQASSPAPGLGSISSFVADGIGQLAVLCAGSGPQGFALNVARRPLQGGWELTPVQSQPAVQLGLTRLQSNRHGDLLLYWYGTAVGPAPIDGAAWCPADAPSWTPLPLPTAPPYALRATALDELGALWFSHIDPQAGALQLQRQRPAAATSTSYSLPASPMDWRFGVDGSGNGYALVHTREANQDVLSLFRSAAGGAFDAGQILVRADTLAIQDFVVADCGEAVVVAEEAAGGPSLARRIDTAGNVSAPTPLAGLTVPMLAIAPRGEAWLAFWRVSANPAQAELVALRWRPDEAPAGALVLATAPATGIFGTMAVAVDDAGRAVIGWINGTSAQNLTLRAVRFQ